MVTPTARTNRPTATPIIAAGETDPSLARATTQERPRIAKPQPAQSQGFATRGPRADGWEAIGCHLEKLRCRFRMGTDFAYSTGTGWLAGPASFFGPQGRT